MRNLVLVTAILLVAAAVIFALQLGGAQAAAQVGVALTEYSIRMTSTSVPAGLPVTFTATNKGQTTHEVVLEKVGAVDQPLETNGGEAEIQDIAPGETKSAIWTITQPGVYQLACHVPGHFEEGMVQRFTVVSASGSDNGLIGASLQLSASPRLTENAVTGVALWWFAAALVIPIVAAYATFRLIVRCIRATS